MDYITELFQEIKNKMNELEIMIALNKPYKIEKTPQQREIYKQMTTEEIFNLQRQIYNNLKATEANNDNYANR
ncbi:MAG: hypothetical protein IJ352_09330 [Muribaculaceae bacterium]|nr:hypothetical protein [Muribaculaceae bacterium]